MGYEIILTIVGLLVFANFVIIWILYAHFQKEMARLSAKLSDLDMDTRIADVFSGKDDGKSIFDLANDLFEHVKSKYRIKTHSYSDMIKELSKLGDMDDNLRDSLIDFFEHMIVISYKKEGQHFEHEKEYLKGKLKLIIHSLEQEKSKR